jgi:hypothetical protein
MADLARLAKRLDAQWRQAALPTTSPRAPVSTDADPDFSSGERSVAGERSSVEDTLVSARQSAR